MANFTEGYTSQDMGGSGLPVQSASQAPSGAAAGLSFASGLVNMYAKDQMEQAKKNKAKQISAATSRFSQQQLQIADAVDRGDMSSQKARRLMRVNYSKAIADNPSLQGEIADAHKNIITTKGLGAVAAEGTELEQQRMKLQNSAMQEGWITEDMSQEDAEEATQNFASFKRHQSMLEAASKELGLKRAKLGYQTDKVQHSSAIIANQRAQLGLEQQKAEIRSQQALSNMADSFFPHMKKNATNVIDQVDRGQLSTRDAIDQLDSQALEIKRMVSQLGGQAGSEYAANIAQPLLDTIDYAKQRVNGKIDNDILNTKMENIQQRSALNLLNDPELQRFSAAQALFRNSNVLSLVGESKAAALLLGKNSEEGGKPSNLFDGDETGTASYLKAAKTGMDEVTRGSDPENPERMRQEVNNNVNKILKGVNAYQMAVDDPSEYNKVVDFLASDSYGRYVESNGTGISKENATAAKQVLMQQYEQGAKEAVQREWEKAQTNTSTLPSSPLLGTDANMEDTSSLIQPTWTGTGMTFVSSSSSARVQAKVKELNRRVAPVVNRMTRLGAHLNGDTNYEKVYKESYGPIFGQTGEGDESQAE